MFSNLKHTSSKHGAAPLFIWSCLFLSRVWVGVYCSEKALAAHPGSHSLWQAVHSELFIENSCLPHLETSLTRRVKLRTKT